MSARELFGRGRKREKRSIFICALETGRKDAEVKCICAAAMLDHRHGRSQEGNQGGNESPPLAICKRNYKQN